MEDFKLLNLKQEEKEKKRNINTELTILTLDIKTTATIANTHQTHVGIEDD